jgi:5'-nucleotidase
MKSGVSALIAALCLVAGAGIAAAETREPVDLQILDVSDWHAQLDPAGTAPAPLLGGAAVLSAYFRADETANPNTLILTAGDAFGGSPPLSAFFDEEPAVKAMNLMGFDADTFGNHNFDRGVQHLASMMALATFPYVCANLDDPNGELPGLKSYIVRDVGGVKVGIVGVINPEAPTLVFPGRFGTVQVTDPVPAANHARALAIQDGAKVIVCLAHMGVTAVDPATGVGSGPLVDFASAVGGFDVILGDHTNVAFSAVINNALVVENLSKGAAYARVKLRVDPDNGRILDRSVAFVPALAAAVTPDAAIVDMLAPYRTQLAAVFDTGIGVATASFPRGSNVERLREVAIGNLIADSMRWRYGTQLALTNSGGIRAPLPSSYLPVDKTLRRPATGYASGPPYDLVIGDVFTVLPFGNTVSTRSVTGAQIWAALEHGLSALPGANGRFLQISGFKFSYKLSAPVGSRVLSVELPDGTPIPADSATYTLATNDFVNAGGDGYTMLADGQGVTREIMADVLVDYIRSLGTITPTTEGRITQLP